MWRPLVGYVLVSVNIVMGTIKVLIVALKEIRIHTASWGFEIEEEGPKSKKHQQYDAVMRDLALVPAA